MKVKAPIWVTKEVDDRVGLFEEEAKDPRELGSEWTRGCPFVSPKFDVAAIT